MRSRISYCPLHLRFLGALERRREGDHQLRDHVEAEARDLAGEAFTRFMSELYKRIYHLICRHATQGVTWAWSAIIEKAVSPPIEQHTVLNLMVCPVFVLLLRPLQMRSCDV